MRNATYARDLDNLRGDASSTGQEIGLWLAGFRFDNGEGSAMLDYAVVDPAKGDTVSDEDLKFVERTLRAMGWEAEIGGDNEGTQRVCVKAEATLVHQWRPSTNEHPKFPADEWRFEITNDDTVLGYHDWVEHQIEAAK